MVEKYVKEYFECKLKDLASRFNIPEEELIHFLHVDSDTYNNPKCKAQTVLGNPCKYKSCNGEAFCLKHKNLHRKTTK